MVELIVLFFNDVYILRNNVSNFVLGGIGEMGFFIYIFQGECWLGMVKKFVRIIYFFILLKILMFYFFYE